MRKETSGRRGHESSPKFEVAVAIVEGEDTSMKTEAEVGFLAIHPDLCELSWSHQYTSVVLGVILLSARRCEL